MAGMIPQPFIDDILNRTNIVELISSRITLKRSGGGYKACCPFHKEKTPSFNVVADKQYYHCFGCGAHGDAISFLREFDNLSFNEAVEDLAKSAGLEIPKDEAVKKQFDISQRLFSALTFAAEYYRKQLQVNPLRQHAQEYLSNRGLSADIIDTYQLGFAPPERNNLGAHCSNDQLKALIETKIVSNKYDRPFDLFQNRIMFPIRNPRGKTVAFGGRTLGNDKAKYINSPESSVFHKSNEVYGLYEAYKANRQLERLIVVEGYMDVVSLAQYEITYAVATLGTATNQDNLTSLLRHCKHIIFCFDGDQAGISAAHKAMHNCLPLTQDGVQIQFLLLPEGEDPDTLVRKEGKRQFEQRIDNARPLSSFFFDVHSEGLDLDIPEHKGLLKKRAEPEIELIASNTIKGAIKDQLRSLTNSFFNKQKNQPYNNNPKNKSSYKGNFQNKSNDNGYYKKAVTPITTKRKPDIATCMALYFHPGKAADFSATIEQSQLGDSFPSTLNFAQLILNQNVSTNKELLISIATHSDSRNYLYTLFDDVEFIPPPEDALKEAEDTLNKAAKEKRRFALLEKSTPLSSEEKEELRMLSTFQEATTQ